MQRTGKNGGGGFAKATPRKTEVKQKDEEDLAIYVYSLYIFSFCVGLKPM